MPITNINSISLEPGLVPSRVPESCLALFPLYPLYPLHDVISLYEVTSPNWGGQELVMDDLLQITASAHFPCPCLKNLYNQVHPWI